MKHICEVVRPIQRSEDETLQPGTIVDASDWPNREVLIEQKMLRLAPMAAGSADGDAALRAQVAEIEGRVAALEKQLASERSAKAPRPARAAKPTAKQPAAHA